MKGFRDFFILSEFVRDWHTFTAIVLQIELAIFVPVYKEVR